jgi:hydroxymethylpyrimidine/phosphomethylpyrimidine kinase
VLSNTSNSMISKPDRRESIFCALTIAGSDSGGGAGIQADLKTFAALRAHGCSVVTCVTAQNPREVRRVQGINPKMVQCQIDAVMELRPRAAKTGMLYSRPIVRAVAAALKQASFPVVVDPVMIATSGAVLLEPPAIRSMIDELFPIAALITPNLDEAGLLLGRKISDLEEARVAARQLHARLGCAVLVKGGHLRGTKTAADFFRDGEEEWLLEAPFVRDVSTHGTGCTYSAAITACLARGRGLREAVRVAKEFVSNAIAQSQRCARFWVLDHASWKPSFQNEIDPPRKEFRTKRMASVADSRT